MPWWRARSANRRNEEFTRNYVADATGAQSGLPARMSDTIPIRSAIRRGGTRRSRLSTISLTGMGSLTRTGLRSAQQGRPISGGIWRHVMAFTYLQPRGWLAPSRCIRTYTHRQRDRPRPCLLGGALGRATPPMRGPFCCAGVASATQFRDSPRCNRWYTVSAAGKVPKESETYSLANSLASRMTAWL